METRPYYIIRQQGNHRDYFLTVGGRWNDQGFSRLFLTREEAEQEAKTFSCGVDILTYSTQQIEEDRRCGVLDHLRYDGNVPTWEQV